MRRRLLQFLLLWAALVVSSAAAWNTKGFSIPNPFMKKPKKSTFETISAKILPPSTTKATTAEDKTILAHTTQNVLAGLASAIALIPEASTFAMTAGLNPLVGLGSTIVLATICGSIGGRPGLVSGATATVSMILKPLVEQEGHLAMSLAVLLAGIIQIGLGMTRCGKYMRVIPRPVMIGFVNGLSIKVVSAQIPHFEHPQNHGVWLQGDALKWHSLLVIASALIIEWLPKFTKAIPSPLASLALMAIWANTFQLPVPRLVDMVGPETFEGGLSSLKRALFPFAQHPRSFLKIFPPLFGQMSSDKLARILKTAMEMALVGLLQSLLTLQIVDEKTRKRCGKNTQESIAQGVANVVSGSMGGMGGSALLGQSLVNVNSGGTGRLSSIAVAGFVTCGVTFFAPLLGGLPVAALVGLMFTIAQHTFSWDLLRDAVKGKVPFADILIIGLVSWTTAFRSMVSAVTLGVLASALRFAWQASCNLTTKETGSGTGSLNSRYIRVKGQLFFASSSTFQKLCEPTAADRETANMYRKRLANKLNKKKRGLGSNNGNTNAGDSSSLGELPDTIRTGRETIIDFIDSQVWDHAAMMAIEAVAQEYHYLGVQLHLKHLSSDCREKLLESYPNLNELSNTELDEDPANDPTYLVGEDPKYSK